MYLSFYDNHVAELRISIDESYKLMLTEDMVERFNYVDFMEDILSIKLNEYRNFLLRNLGGDGDLLLDPTHYDVLEYELREEGIIPERWKCKTSGLILFLMNSGIASINRFYNTMLLLKQNDFFTKDYKTHISPPFLSNGVAVFGKTEMQKNRQLRVLRIFSTSLEMMFYDLLCSIKDSGVISHVEDVKRILRYTSYQDKCYSILSDSREMNFGSFCAKYFPAGNCSEGYLQTIFNCISSPAINGLLLDEIRSVESTSWYGEDLDYIFAGDLAVIPTHTFSNADMRDRFECYRYLSGLYKKYEIPGMYRITPDGADRWLGLIVNKLVSEGYRFKKCKYCNSFSLFRDQNVCDECKERFRLLLDADKKRNNARRKNKTDMLTSNRDPIVVDFYIELYEKLHELIEDNFTNMLREESFDRQKPLGLDYGRLSLSVRYTDDFDAQDIAERELLAFKPHSEYRYNLILELWTMFMIPKRFVKAIYDKEGYIDLRDITAAFFEVIDIKELKCYAKLAEHGKYARKQ